jgi:hypothetical protein
MQTAPCSRREPNEPHEARVTLPVNDHEFAEILVERDKRASLLQCSAEDRLVARILRPVANPGDVVSRGLDLRTRATPDTGVE